MQIIPYARSNLCGLSRMHSTRIIENSRVYFKWGVAKPIEHFNLIKSKIKCTMDALISTNKFYWKILVCYSHRSLWPFVFVALSFCAHFCMSDEVKKGGKTQMENCKENEWKQNMAHKRLLYFALFSLLFLSIPLSPCAWHTFLLKDHPFFYLCWWKRTLNYDEFSTFDSANLQYKVFRPNEIVREKNNALLYIQIQQP